MQFLFTLQRSTFCYKNKKYKKNLVLAYGRSGPDVYSFVFSCWCSIWRKCCGPTELRSRTIHLGKPTVGSFPANAIKNRKYNIITFLPLVLFQQFKFFLNLYFLVMATSQFIPDIRIGYLYTYWGPLVRIRQSYINLFLTIQYFSVLFYL